MAELLDGAKVEVQGSGTNRYTLARKGDLFSCTCPAWLKQATRIEQRTCKHLRAYLGDAVETARVGAAPPPPRPVPNRIRAPLHRRYVEDREVRDEREAALAKALSRFPVLDDRMQLVYGLRLPRHLAYGIGWWMGLTSAEQREVSLYLGNGPAGVGEWFLDGALERTLKPGLDERLDYRFRCDPPEMVTIFTGNSDGRHWGLWYADPAKLPSGIVENYARDSAETSPCKRTLLETIHDEVAQEDPPWQPEEWPHRRAALAWLEDVLERELEAWSDDRVFFAADRHRSEYLLGGMGSVDPNFAVPSDFASFGAQDERNKAYKSKDPVVGEWIALARSELEAGEPRRALFLGRELHYIDADEWRDECTDLLVRAYEALGRHALAEIVKVHHRQRDLPQVDVYEHTLGHPFADELHDLSALRAALAARPPTESQLVALLRSQTDLALVDVVLDVPGAKAVTTPVIVGHIDQVESLSKYVADSPTLRAPLEAHRAAAIRLFERVGARGAAFTGALASPDEELRAAASKHADLEWRSPRGRSVLHIAARAGSVRAVDDLLVRGADPRVVDQDGKTPYDAAREAWQSSPAGASRIFDLLTARGGGPPPPPKPTTVDDEEWLAGTAVKHARFGDGVVEAVAGAGEATKLTIKFGDSVKTLVAKFVTRG